MRATTALQVNLELTVEEAKWLHGVMQNPLSSDPNPENEDSYDRKMREGFFKATAIESHNYD